MSKFEKLSKLCDEISELEKRVRQAAQDEFKPALREVTAILKENVPQVKAVQWQQWIPGFNDGEPCEFTMGDVRFSFRDEDLEEEGDNGDGFIEGSYNADTAQKHLGGEPQKYLYGLTELVVKDKLSHDQAVILDELAETIAGLETAAELAFGPDVQITLNLDSGEVDIEDYDCGY